MTHALSVIACSKGNTKTTSAPSPSFTETCEEDFCIAAVSSERQIDFSLHTEPTAELTLTLSYVLNNMTASVALPLTLAVQGQQDTPFLTLTPTDANTAYSYSFEYAWGYGLNTAQPDTNAIFRLPFATGSGFEVVQGYNGTFSHTGADQYAIDFAMPLGTPVHAARAGTVVAVEQRYDQGGTEPAFKDQANFVKISHDDGTIAEYLHLEKDGVLVTKGETVEAGEEIATSGNTGYSSGPHLHFKVERRIDGATAESLPIQFVTATGASQELEEGQTYTAVEIP